MINENEFAIIMIQSIFKIPYHTQHPKPANSTIIIPIDTLSAFFSFTTFTSCGMSDTDVKTLATTPAIVDVSISMDYNNAASLVKFGANRPGY